MSSNSLCDHLRGQTNQTPATWLSNFVNHSYDYRLNWTPLSPVTITNSRYCPLSCLLAVFATFLANSLPISSS